jgi:hypothetical protein
VSNVSDDEDSPTQPPAVGSRRVSARLAVSVVVGCAVLGSIIGVLRPLRPNLPSAHKVEKTANLTLASAKLVESTAGAAQSRPSTGQPKSVAAGNAAIEPQALAPAPVASVSTGSVDRSPPPGASERAVLIASDRQGADRSEPTTTLTGRSHQIARAKRLKRILWRRVRSKPLGMNIDAFFASLFAKK